MNFTFTIDMKFVKKFKNSYIFTAMESEKPEKPPILPESAPEDIRQIHQLSHSMQAPHMITQPPPPPPISAEQRRLESPSDMSASASINMQPEHKTNLSQPPPNFLNYIQNTKWIPRPPHDFIAHPESLNMNLPPPSLSMTSNIMSSVQKLECCKNNTEAHLNDMMEKELFNLQEELVKEENNVKTLQTTFATLLSIKGELERQVLINSQNKEHFSMPAPESSVRKPPSQNILHSPMHHQYSSSTGNPNISRQQIAVSNTGQEQILFNVIPSNHLQYQNSDMYRTQTVMQSNQVPQMSISSDDQCHEMMSRYDRAMMVHPSMGSQVPMNVVPSNVNLTRPPNPPVIPPPSVGRSMDSHAMGVTPTHHYVNAQMVGNTYSQINMQSMPQPYMQQSTGQIVSTSQAQDACQMSTSLSSEAQKPPQKRIFFDSIRQNLI